MKTSNSLLKNSLLKTGFVFHLEKETLKKNYFCLNCKYGYQLLSVKCDSDLGCVIVRGAVQAATRCFIPLSNNNTLFKSL